MPGFQQTDAPLYLEVRDRLTEAIAQGTWPPGAAIPSESQLATEFGVSIGTLRKAVDDLVARQILVRQQGRGTFVTMHNPRRLMFHFFHIVGSDGAKRYPEVTTLEFKMSRADAETAEKLALPPSEKIIRIRNLLRLDGEAVIVDDIALPADMFPGLNERVFARRENTIYHLYQSRFGINVVRTHERLRAAAAAPGVAALLNVQEGAPLLEIRRVALTYRDKPVEWRISHVNSASHEYENSFGKSEAWIEPSSR
jgi:GntR family transcriptional regulator